VDMQCEIKQIILLLHFSFLFNVIFRHILHKYTNDVSFGYWLIGLDVEHACASKCVIMTSDRPTDDSSASVIKTLTKNLHPWNHSINCNVNIFSHFTQALLHSFILHAIGFELMMSRCK
jgi:hypothetical protein